ncbi:MAG: hypothetical protein ACYSWU_00895 [Planctomycetota bacterium]|jgi:hypothetical protein
MGFRSTFVTEYRDYELPEWFYEKWNHIVHFREVGGRRTFPLSSKDERKTYAGFKDLEPDLVKVVQETKGLGVIRVVWLHECGGLTRSEIRADGIKRTVPYQWELPYDDDYGHEYCYGCSDASKAEE